MAAKKKEKNSHKNKFCFKKFAQVRFFKLISSTQLL